MKSFPASRIADYRQNRTAILVLHGGCCDVHRLSVRLGQSCQCTRLVAGFREAADSTSGHACRRPVNLIWCHTHVRACLHAFERHQLFAGRGQVRELNIRDTPQCVDRHLLRAGHAGRDTQVDDAWRHVWCFVDGFLIVQSFFDFVHVAGGFMIFFVTFFDAFVDGAAVAANLIGCDFGWFDFASNAGGYGVCAACASDFHEFCDP